MVKVNRKIGAVAVYSPLRAGALIVFTALLLLGGGFGIAQLTDDDGGGAVATAQTAAPAPAAAEADRSQLAAADARADRALALLRRVRAQRGKYATRIRRMRRARKTADAGSAPLATGTPYIVVLRKGRGGADYVIGPRSPMQAGTSYRRCPDGNGICARGDGS